MRRALNEVWRLCQKGAEGAGAPAGLDYDAADGALWLLARGFDIVDGFAAALEGLDGGTGAWAFGRVPVDSGIDATDRPGAILAPALVDLLVARAGAPLTITGLSAPLFMLPPAACYAEEGWRLSFTLNGPGGARFVLLALAEAGPAILGPLGGEAIAALLSGPIEFTVEATATPPSEASTMADEDALPSLVDAASFAAAEVRSIAEGIVIEARPWARLQVFSDRMLVPATAESRRRGAGAQSSENE